MDGLPRSGATVKLWSSGAAFLTNPPQKNTALPVTGSPVASTTSGTSHGGDGAYRFNSVSAGDYFVSVEWNGLILYDTFTVGAAVIPEGISTVKSYGAVGDGVTNDTVAIQAALDDTAVNHLFFPPGTYLAGNLNITSRSGLTIEGNGATLDWTGTGTTTAPIGIRITGTCRDLSIRGLRFLGDGVAANYHGGVWWTTAVVVENVAIRECHFESLAVGIWLNRIGSGTVHGVTIEANEFETMVGTGTTQGTGVFVHHENTTPLGVVIRGNAFSGTDRHCVHLSRGSGIKVVDNQSRAHRNSVTGAVQAAIHVQRCTDVIVRGNHLHEYGDGGIALVPTGATAILRVQVRENILTDAVNDVQDINVGTSDPATDGGLDQIQVCDNIIRKSSREVCSIIFQNGLRSRITGNMVSPLQLGSATTGICVTGSGDSGGTRTYTDDVLVADNQLYSDTPANLVGLELGSAFCTSTARAVFRGNRLRGVTMFLSGALITNDQNLHVVDQEDDGLSFDTGIELETMETGPQTFVGSLDLKQRTVTGSYTLTQHDQVIYANTNAGLVTLTFPTALSCPGRAYTIINLTNSFGCQLLRSSSDTFNGLTAYDLFARDQAITFISNGSNRWHVIDSDGYRDRKAVSTVTATTTLDYGHRYVRADPTAGSIVLTLPAVADMPGQVITVVRVTSTANNITLDGNGAETIDGAATYVLPTGAGSVGKFVTIVNTGSAWLTVEATP